MKRGSRVVLIVLGVIVVLIVVGLIAALNGMSYVRHMTVTPFDLSVAPDGTHHGEFARGRFHFAVDVSVADHKITGVTETDKSASDVTRRVAQQIVAQQSLPVDAVSGASLTTKAFSQAVSNALAGGR